MKVNKDMHSSKVVCPQFHYTEEEQNWIRVSITMQHITRVIKADSTFVFNALRRKQVQASQLSRVLWEISVLAFQFSSLQVMFCHRNANVVADLLAKNAAATQEIFVLYSIALNRNVEALLI